MFLPPCPGPIESISVEGKQGTTHYTMVLPTTLSKKGEGKGGKERYTDVKGCELMEYELRRHIVRAWIKDARAYLTG